MNSVSTAQSLADTRLSSPLDTPPKQFADSAFFDIPNEFSSGGAS